ncbi:MAG: cytochrome c-type biogenesis protein CcmH, partial [Gemmatimonadales bacterium]
MPSRREFVGRAAIALSSAMLPSDIRRQRPQRGAKPQPDSTGAAADTLPSLMGRASAPLGPLDNDPGVIAIERRLRCTCGCTLDVYTCRTTDFSCTYSPAMHQDVVARVEQGATPDQIIQAFVNRYGETVLMAPAARGFNLAGYLVPGLTVAGLGLALVAWLSRRQPV